MLRGYGRLLRSAGFRNYAIGGACTTTSFYAYITASPFIFVDLLHRPTEEVGLYYLVVFSGISLGSLVANRFVRRVRPARLLRAASAVAILGAAAFFAAAATHHLSVAAVLAAMLVFTVGIGTASPLAHTRAISTFPQAIGTASGLYGALQMGFGALCTLAVGLWPGSAALAAATVLVVSALLGQCALTMATRRGFGVSD
jgi:DHA1 family bicyclomycin/chloramphenicol resistance-like MFS transporter